MMRSGFFIIVILCFANGLFSQNPKNLYKIYDDSASAMVNSSRFKQAIEYSAKAIKLKPNYAPAYYTRGMANIYEGDTVSACLDFIKAQDLGYKDVNNEDTPFQYYCYDNKGRINIKLRNNPVFKLKNHPPLEFAEANIYYDEIGTPTIRLSMYNNSYKTVDAYKCEIECYNKFNEPVKDLYYHSNKGTVTNQEIILSGRGGGNMTAYPLYNQEATGRAKITLIKVHFSDGTVWIPKKGQKVSITAETNY